MAAAKPAFPPPSLYAALPPDMKIRPLAKRERTQRVFGPKKDNKEESIISRSDIMVSGISSSSFPKRPGTSLRDGDPVADSFRCTCWDNRVIAAVADGCNFGNRPQEAATKATFAFVEHVNGKQTFGDLQEAGKLIEEAFEQAHLHIIANKKGADIWEAGTTSLCGGMIVELKKEDKRDLNWGFICGAVGDIKVYRWTPKQPKGSRVMDVTENNRFQARDERDPGGRLGPYLDEGLPDLRNFRLYWTPCDKGDMFFFLTRGVYENFHPMMQGKTPKDIPDLSVSTWEEAEKNALAQQQITLWMNSQLEQLIENHGASPTISKAILTMCMQITSARRTFMEDNQSARPPTDYVSFPGKLDHMTALVLRVGVVRAPLGSMRKAAHPLVAGSVNNLLSSDPSLSTSPFSFTASGNVNGSTNGPIAERWEWRCFFPLTPQITTTTTEQTAATTKTNATTLIERLADKNKKLAMAVQKLGKEGTQHFTFYLNFFEPDIILRQEHNAPPKHGEVRTAPLLLDARIKKEEKEGFDCWRHCAQLSFDNHMDKHHLIKSVITSLSQRGFPQERIIQVSSSIDSFLPSLDTLLVRERKRVLSFGELGNLYGSAAGDLALAESDLMVMGKDGTCLGTFHSIHLSAAKPKYIKPFVKQHVVPYLLDVASSPPSSSSAQSPSAASPSISARVPPSVLCMNFSEFLCKLRS
ncbi:TipA [Balamuthia mandrillaris]